MPTTQEINIPVESAIIERMRSGETEIHIQTRWKPGRDPLFTLQLPVIDYSLHYAKL